MDIGCVLAVVPHDLIVQCIELHEALIYYRHMDCILLSDDWSMMMMMMMMRRRRRRRSDRLCGDACHLVGSKGWHQSYHWNPQHHHDYHYYYYYNYFYYYYYYSLSSRVEVLYSSHHLHASLQPCHCCWYDHHYFSNKAMSWPVRTTHWARSLCSIALLFLRHLRLS